MADGGDGSIEIMKSLMELVPSPVKTVDPLGREIQSSYSVSGDTAFIELASASGLVLLQEEDRNPMYTSTRGTGLEIKDAIENGFKKIYLFIGGSATNDAGIGMAQALGYDFLDEQGKRLEPIGANLSKIRSIKNHQHYNFEELEINALCDVTNPMFGPLGAAHTYAKQKGANSEEILELEKGLVNYAQVLKKEYDMELATMPGMGAAGAVGASLYGIMGAQLKNGFQMLADLTQLEKHIEAADLVITGEGKIDPTSFQGKVVGNVLALCNTYNTPCGLVGGIIEDMKEYRSRFVFSHAIIFSAENEKDAMHNSRNYLMEIGKKIALTLQ